jgi:hypothetical protein
MRRQAPATPGRRGLSGRKQGLRGSCVLETDPAFGCAIDLHAL